MRITAAKLADRLGLAVEGDGSVEISGVSSLEDAGPSDLVFCAQTKMLPLLEKTRAAAGILPAGESTGRGPLRAAIRAANPLAAFAAAISVILPERRPEPGVHPTAFVSPTARLGAGVSIGAMSCVGDGAEIGAGTIVFPLVSIYPGVRIGADCRIHSSVSLREDVRLGDRVILHNGVQIGGDGFRYVPNADGTHMKIPQVGTVIIEDDVEIGANSAVDRAGLGATIVRRGTKIDNLVTVGHNVEVGENAILVAQVGIGGSSKIGRGAILSGQAGIPDHINIGDGVIVAAKSGITKDVPAGKMVSGSPHLDIRDWRKFWAVAPELYDFYKDFKKLKARVAELEAEISRLNR